MKKIIRLLGVYVVVNSSFSVPLDGKKRIVYDDWSISDGTNTWTNCFNAEGCADFAEALNAARERRVRSGHYGFVGDHDDGVLMYPGKNSK